VSVKIRLTRMGRRNRPFYRVVVADSRSRRDGRFIEQIGTYDPIKENNNFSVQEDRVFHWLKVGAQPSDTVKRMLSKEGIMLKWHLENSNISEDQKKIELQKWELAKKAKDDKKEAPATSAKATADAPKEVEAAPEEAAPVKEATPVKEAAAVKEEIPEVPVEESTSAKTTADVPKEKAPVSDKDTAEKAAE